jgi:hypothetical protein
MFMMGWTRFLDLEGAVIGEVKSVAPDGCGV